MAGFRTSPIEDYCSHQSVRAGETLHILVSTAPAAKFQIEIFRTGYYQGRGARIMTTLGPLQGKPQPVPPAGARRLRECKWEPSASLKIPADWTSGVYLGRLTTLPEKDSEPYWQSYVVFVVRDDWPADILFQVSDNTWQAYNRWPDNYSVYTEPKGTQVPQRGLFTVGRNKRPPSGSKAGLWHQANTPAFVRRRGTSSQNSRPQPIFMVSGCRAAA
jgi:hypothetical protein